LFSTVTEEKIVNQLDKQPGVARTRGRTSRAYNHDQCGKGTVVKGADFERVANPFLRADETVCAGCGDIVSLHAVHWQDTGESLSAYRRRLARMFAKQRWIGAAVGALFGLLVLPIVFFALPNMTPDAFIIGTSLVMGPGIGLIVGWFYLPPILLNSIWKVDFREID
jgi:hypothetical protein